MLEHLADRVNLAVNHDVNDADLGSCNVARVCQVFVYLFEYNIEEFFQQLLDTIFVLDHFFHKFLVHHCLYKFLSNPPERSTEVAKNLLHFLFLSCVTESGSYLCISVANEVEHRFAVANHFSIA